MTENNVVHQARLHWIIFVIPLMTIGVIPYAASQLARFDIPVIIYYGLLIFGLIWLGIVALTYVFSYLIIKKRQVILCTGILVRQTIDIPMSKIESIDIRQSVLGSVLRYGSLVITGTGGTRQVVDYLNNPLTCRRYIEQMMHEE
jgi:uncharacterized membrane protein YdbT with pleckstrin-like domain